MGDLRKCERCGAMISWTADICPYCHCDTHLWRLPGEPGYPFDNNNNINNNNTNSQIDSNVTWGDVGLSWEGLLGFLKWGGYIVGGVLILVWMFALEFDFEWEFFQVCVYGICAIVVGIISGFILKKIE